VSYVGTEQNASGIMYVGSTANYGGMASQLMLSYQPQAQSFPMKAGGSWTFYVPMNSFPAYEAVTGVGFMTEAWPAFFLFWRGLPASTSPIVVRDVRAVEYYPEISSLPFVDLKSEPYDPVGFAEAGMFPGTAQENGTDEGPSWASKLGKATYDFVGGVAAGFAERNAAREVLREHMMGGRIQVLEL